MFTRLGTLVGIGVAVTLLLSSPHAEARKYLWIPIPSGELEIGGHALYFTPTTCPYAYASVFQSLGGFGNNGRAQLIPCQADWGFRIFGEFVGDCILVGLSYQRFATTTTRSVDTSGLVRIRGGSLAGPGRATGQTSIEYQRVDARWGLALRRRCSRALYLYGNGRWVDLSYRRSSRAFFLNQTSEEVAEKSQLSGGAIGCGLLGEFDLWCGLGAFFDGNLLGVIGQRSIKEARFKSNNGVTVTVNQESYPSDTCVLPEVNLRIGVDYTYVCRCWKLVGEIGYEVDYFWQGAVFPKLVDVNVPNSGRSFTPTCEDIGFSGLFFGGRLLF